MAEGRAPSWRTAALALAIGLLLLYMAGTVLQDPLHPEATAPQDRYALLWIMNFGLGLLALLAIDRARVLRGRERAGVALLGIGLAAWTAGNWAWVYYNYAGVDVPYPSFADVGYLTLTATAITGLLVLFLPHRRRIQGVDIAIAVALPVTIGVLFYAFLIEGRASLAGDALTQALNIAYPAADMVYVALAGLMLFFTSPSWIHPSMRRVALGLLGVAAADVAFITTVDAGAYFTGSWVDLGYILGLAAYGLAVVRFDPQPAAPVAKPAAQPLVVAVAR
jgi:hypothetical protein